MENFVMIIDRDAKNYLRDNAAVIEQLKNDDRFVKIGNSVFGVANTVPVAERPLTVGKILVNCVTESVTIITNNSDGTSNYRIGPVSTSL